MEENKASLLDVAGLLRGEKREIDIDMSVASAELDVPDVTVTDPPRIVGKIVNMSGYIELSAIITVCYDTHCSRCTKKLSKKLALEVKAPVAETLENMDNDEYIIPDNGMINMSELIRESFLLNVPMAHLCSETCKGLCPKCGCDRNETECGCVLQEKDPRWKGLEGFFDED